MRKWQLTPLVFSAFLLSACDPYKAEVSRLDAFAGFILLVVPSKSRHRPRSYRLHLGSPRKQLTRFHL